MTDSEVELLIEKIVDNITNSYHSEKPVVEHCDHYITIETDLWEPELYNLTEFVEWGLTFCGEVRGRYFFKIDNWRENNED